jgi:hypothetical protein
VGKPKAPTPPDPKATAAAQTGTNIGTAIAQGAMNNTNQVTPYGSLNYDQTGTYAYKDPLSGQSYDLPQYTATQTLSPEQQAILGQTNAAELNLAETANERSGFLQEYLRQPFSLGNEATEARLFDLGRKRLDPMFADQQQQLEASLSNRGLKLGSEDYAKELDRFGRGKSDAYNSLLLSGRGQAVSESMAERNQPINEISALLSNSQVQSPSFVNTPQANLPTVDYAGLVQNNFASQMAAYNQKMKSRDSTIGGLFGLGAGGLAGGYF